MSGSLKDLFTEEELKYLKQYMDLASRISRVRAQINGLPTELTPKEDLMEDSHD